VDVIFDPPYYKLRLGGFATRQDAEDMLADLAERGIQGFVVRQ
jgi:cell division septation protein DedD